MEERRGEERVYDSLLGLARYLVMSYDLLLSPNFEGLLVHTYNGNAHYLLFSFLCGKLPSKFKVTTF
jgi:hypothetical protein